MADLEELRKQIFAPAGSSNVTPPSTKKEDEPITQETHARNNATGEKEDNSEVENASEIGIQSRLAAPVNRRTETKAELKQALDEANAKVSKLTKAAENAQKKADASAADAKQAREDADKAVADYEGKQQKNMDNLRDMFLLLDKKSNELSDTQKELADRRVAEEKARGDALFYLEKSDAAEAARSEAEEKVADAKKALEEAKAHEEAAQKELETCRLEKKQAQEAVTKQKAEAKAHEEAIQKELETCRLEKKQAQEAVTKQKAEAKTHEEATQKELETCRLEKKQAQEAVTRQEAVIEQATAAQKAAEKVASEAEKRAQAATENLNTAEKALEICRLEKLQAQSNADHWQAEAARASEALRLAESEASKDNQRAQEDAEARRSAERKVKDLEAQLSQAQNDLASERTRPRGDGFLRSKLRNGRGFRHGRVYIEMVVWGGQVIDDTAVLKKLAIAAEEKRHVLVDNLLFNGNDMLPGDTKVFTIVYTVNDEAPFTILNILEGERCPF